VNDEWYNLGGGREKIRRLKKIRGENGRNMERVFIVVGNLG
jgi:hypothetical protein